MNRNLTIILRTCNRVFAQHGNRYVKKSKSEIINVCVSSLVNSINNVQGHNVKLFVLDDHSDDQCIQNIKNILSHCKFPSTLIQSDVTGNAESMGKVYDLVEQHAIDLWYHVEDDYLHTEDAIQDMLDSVDQFEANTGQMVAINPHDDIWRYIHQIYESVLLLGPYRHYRTVRHTTYTCLASKQLYDKYRNHFRDIVKLTAQRADWVEDKSINLVWNKPDVMLFSPIPGLGFHIMEESGKDPYFDFDALWNSVPCLWGDKKSSQKIAVVSIFNNNHKSLADITWVNKVNYCKKHNYLAIAKTENFSPEQVHFDKFIHILDVMNKHPDVDWVWWIDNDAMITNFNQKLENLVDNDYHVIMGTDIAALNTGSFIVKNSPEGRGWLNFLLSKKKEYRNDNKWFEQQAVIDFYPKFQNIFKLLAQKSLNSYDYKLYNVDSTDLLGYDGQWSQGDFVIHWPGLPNDTRVRLAEHYKKYIQDTQ